jgi:hypothetical protein
MRSPAVLLVLHRRARASALATSLLAAAFAPTASMAAPPATKGELLLETNFEAHAIYTKEPLPLAPGWRVRVAHGRFERSAEGVRGIWESGHNPTLVVEGEFRDVIVEVDFRYQAEPGKWAACRLSAANRELHPRAYAVSTWANVDFKSRGRGFVLEHDNWDGPITRVGYKKADFAPDTWHTLRLEVVGDAAAAECAGVRVTGRHEKFGLPKTSIWLGTGQSPHELRRLRVYRAVPAAPTEAAPAPVAAPTEAAPAPVAAAPAKASPPLPPPPARSPAPASAAKAPNSAAIPLAEPGELLLAEDFRTADTFTKERRPLGTPGWQVRIAHGLWRPTADGVESTETPGHQPVLVLEGAFGDCVIELDFRYRTGTPTQWAACRISATNTVALPRSYAASVWANVDYKSRAVGLVLEHDQWNGHVTQVARKLAEFQPDTWYALRVEIVGDRVRTTCNGVTVIGRWDTFSQPKNSLWLATGLSPHELRRLRVYAAKPAVAAPPAAATPPSAPTTAPSAGGKISAIAGPSAGEMLTATAGARAG